MLALAAGAVASPARASSQVQFGIQDDAWLEYGPGTLERRLATFRSLGVPLVRYTLRWNEIAKRRPRDATVPGDRAYDWRRQDRILRGLRRHGLTPVVTLVGTPAWANGGRGPAFAPPRPRDFRRFATAAARRYPWVRHWLIWNEPNKRLWLRPTRSKIYVQHLLNPGYDGIKAVLPRALVGGGATGPKGGAGGVSPTAWVRGMWAAGARFDAYAHHPYPSSPAETPSSGGCRNCPFITMATIRKLLILVKRSWGSKPVWLTEYGYQTNPPDTLLGVTLKRQATNLSLAAMRAWRLPRVTMLIQYLYKDEPILSRFQDRARVRGRPLEAVAAGVPAPVRADGPGRRARDPVGPGARREAGAEALPARGAAAQRVAAGGAGAADQRGRGAHADGTRQARRAVPDPVSRAGAVQRATPGQVSSVRLNPA
jgi:hypothetical protein